MSTQRTSTTNGAVHHEQNSNVHLEAEVAQLSRHLTRNAGLTAGIANLLEGLLDRVETLEARINSPEVRDPLPEDFQPLAESPEEDLDLADSDDRFSVTEDGA